MSKRTYQPSVRKRKEKISTVLKLEWLLKTEEKFWLAEEQKEDIS